MTEEELQAKIQEATEEAEKRAAEAQQAAEAAKAEADKARTDLEGVVNELKDERAKKNEALEKLGSINNPKTETAGSPDVETLVEKKLREAEEKRIQDEISSAIDEFKSSKTEFQNDSSGLVFDKFKNELSKFNFSDVKSKEAAKKRLEEVYRFVRQTSSEEDDGTAYDGSPRSAATPPATDANAIPADIKKTLQDNGISEDAFQKIASKSNYSDALASLGFGR